MNPIIESIGIEFETDNIIRGNNTFRDFQEEHDASIESYRYTDKLVPNLLFDKPVTMRSTSHVVGTEYKSRVLSFNCKEDIYPIIESFLNSIEDRGECPESKRSGVHIHVCMPYSLQILKNIMKVGAHLEQVFFYLGGMGYTNRGIYNDFSFCRPITDEGPIVTTSAVGKSQCFVLKDLYETKSAKEFFYRYGGINMANPPGKYVPVRYHWLTLYPLLTYSTIEYRIFNKTLNPNYLYTIVKFCQSVSSEMISGTKELKENSIFSEHTKDSVIGTLENFIKRFELELTDIEIGTLINIIERTPAIKLKRNYVHTHLDRSDGRLAPIFGNDYCPPNIPKNLISYPEVVTIHTMNRNETPVLEQ